MAAPKKPNPPGAKSDKEWRDAIRKAVHELRTVNGDKKAEKIKAITLLGRRLVTKAMEGDVAALKEIGDRLDGKPVQGVELGVDVKITKVEYRIVDARVVDGELAEPAAEALTAPLVAIPAPDEDE